MCFRGGYSDPHQLNRRTKMNELTNFLINVVIFFIIFHHFPQQSFMENFIFGLLIALTYDFVKFLYRGLSNE